MLRCAILQVNMACRRPRPRGSTRSCQMSLQQRAIKVGRRPGATSECHPYCWHSRQNSGTSLLWFNFLLYRLWAVRLYYSKYRIREIGEMVIWTPCGDYYKAELF